MRDDLGKLFAEARSYGLVDLCTLDGGTYSCSILIARGTREMKAKSGSDHLTPAAAVKAAIQATDRILRIGASSPAPQPRRPSQHNFGPPERLPVILKRILAHSRVDPIVVSLCKPASHNHTLGKSASPP
jgi:hypothetical protein